MKRAGQKKLGRLWIWTWIITKAQQRKRPGTIFTYINSLHLEESILIGWGFFRNPPRSDLGELKKKKINPRPIQTFTTVTHLSSKSADTNHFLQVLICILCWCWKDPIRSWWELWSHRKISSIRFVQYPIWAVVSSVTNLIHLTPEYGADRLSSTRWHISKRGALEHKTCEAVCCQPRSHRWQSGKLSKHHMNAASLRGNRFRTSCQVNENSSLLR